MRNGLGRQELSEAVLSSPASAEPERAQRGAVIPNERSEPVSSRASAASRGICTWPQRSSTAGTRISPDAPDKAGSAPCGWRDLSSGPRQRCEVMDGEAGCAGAWSSTRRGTDPASSRASGPFRGPAVEEARRKIRPLPRHRRSRSAFRRSTSGENRNRYSRSSLIVRSTASL